jgi:ADP-ribosylglycohydrolase
MRIAPVALLAGYGGDRRDLAGEISALTHGHPTGQEAAAAWVDILERVLAGQGLREAAALAQSGSGGETASAIAAALSAPGNGQPETVEGLGGGWVAEEALSIALYAGLNSGSLEEGLRIAVTHSGDSDSTGAIAGNLLGLLYPDEVMSHPWRRALECADLIRRLARDLAAEDADELEFATYPGW